MATDAEFEAAMQSGARRMFHHLTANAQSFVGKVVAPDGEQWRARTTAAGR